MQEYSVAVIGAGASGIMAAIYSALNKAEVVLIEKNANLGRKILISGKGRCNLTNIAQLDDFLKHFNTNPDFLRNAFAQFFNQELMDFFEEQGLKLKTERGGRVFPLNDKSASVLGVLKRKLTKLNVHLLFNSRVKNLIREDTGWLIETVDSGLIKTKKVILATGGASYALTGSTGDGYKIAESLGHKIIPLKPGLVALETKEPWVQNLAGLTLKNVRISFLKGKKTITSETGEMIFTHFGVSGPLILELSSKIVDWFGDEEKIILKIDLKPGLDEEQLDSRLIRDLKEFGSRNFKNVLKELLPGKLIDICLKITDIPASKKANQLSLGEREKLIDFLKGFSLTITKTRPLNEAIVTKGGVSTREINPKTMESKLLAGLYFCGEIIDIDADTGGYNLQAAFSTGYLAGKSAAESLN